MLAQRARVGVRLVAHFADIGLVRGVHVHVLLAIAAVGKAPVTAFKFTFERFLTYKRQKHKEGKICSGPQASESRAARDRVPGELPREGAPTGGGYSISFPWRKMQSAG